MKRPIAIDIVGVRKAYGTTRALHELSLQIEEGELFGVIGADGAGKSTLFELMVTLITPDAGRIRVGRFEVATQKREIRSSVGYMPGRFSLYQDLGVRENLEFFATLYGTTLEAGMELIAPIWNQLAPFSDRPAGKLSGGMKQKLALCCAMIHRPEILFLDEPTTGVDPVSRREFWEMLKGLNRQGITIVVSTPYMDEALLCDRIALMQEGRVLGVNSPEWFPTDYPYALYSLTTTEPYRLINELRSEPETIRCFAFGHSVHWSVAKEEADEVIGRLEGEGLFCPEEIRRITPTLEDCFINLMEDAKR